VKCHAAKGSPFVFEHASGFVEGCTACHHPHGSPNRYMLSFQSIGELCYSCHGVVPSFHSRFNADTVCTNCHYAIHGSNLDPFFLK
jgi:predicted CXXCH cytochrome family protein